MTKIGDRIRVMRIRQARLAELLGVRRSTIGNYERGDRYPDPDTIEALADIFNCRIDDLFDQQPTKFDGLSPLAKSFAVKFEQLTPVQQQAVRTMIDSYQQTPLPKPDNLD